MQPTSPANGYYISDFPGLITPATELPGGLLEVEVPLGPVAGGYVNRKLTIEQLVAYLQETARSLSLTDAQANPPIFGQSDLITGNWNNQNPAVSETVVVAGGTNGLYAPTGYLVTLVPGVSGPGGVTPAKPKLVPVTVDVAAGTYAVQGGGGNDYIDGDTANENVVVGVVTSSRRGVIASTDTVNIIVHGEGNQITSGNNNTILGGRNNEIQGGFNNGIAFSDGCTIPDSCSALSLLNCLNFTPPANTSNATYINNVLANSGGSTGPQLDIYGATPAKRNQVLNVLFTSPTQFKAVDVALSGDTSTGIGSRIPDFANGDIYELMPDVSNPMSGPGGTTVGTPTWLRLP